jgi:putative transcriptional regulator
MDKKIFNNHIQECRLQRGLTQEELADLVGVSRQTIISIEKGNYVPSLELAFALAHVFKSTVEKLFFISKKA